MLRRVVTVLVAVAVMLMGSAMAAFACTNLATLNLSETVAQPGTEIDITGTSFATADSPVQVRWDGTDGAVLAEVATDGTGTFETVVTVPADAEPGHHVLVVTQMVEGDSGPVPAYGTPAKTSFFVGATGPPAEIAQQPAVAPAAATPEIGASSGLLGLLAGLALAGVGLFGTGIGLFVRDVRRRSASQPAALRNS